MNTSPLLAVRLDGVGKRFDTQAALDGIDLDVSPGSFLAVMGANGAGKTTLLNVIAGLTAPTAGRITIAGVDMQRAGPRLRAQIGVVGHRPMLYPDLTAGENLQFHARLFGVPDPASAVGEAATLMDVVDVLDRPVRTLSRGTTQRVALARALVHRPRVLLLDEPFTGLDEVAARSLSDLLVRLHTSDRVLLVTLHDIARAVEGPERVVVLSRGRIVHDGSARGSVLGFGDEYVRLLRAEVAS
jgi:heme ABC exporter ATP-binding subunit CcmA